MVVCLRPFVYIRIRNYSRGKEALSAVISEANAFLK